MLFTVLEVAFVGVLVAGVALIHLPAALILLGLLGIVACERASAKAGAAEKTKGARR